MDFSGLVKGVQDFWDFIWPPVLCLIALVGTASYIAPEFSRRIWVKAISSRPTDKRQIEFMKILRRFGFDKLLPLICAFFLIFFLDILRNLVLMGGQAIPPVITYDPSTLILNSVDDAMVQCLWRTRAEIRYKQTKAPYEQTEVPTRRGESSIRFKNPSMEDKYMRLSPVGFYEISQIIDAAVADAREQHKDSPVVNGLRHAEESVSTTHMVFSALKFLFLYSCLICLLELRHSTLRTRVVFRTTLLLGILLLGNFVYFLRYLRMSEQMEAVKRYVAQVYPIKDSINCKGFDAATNSELDSFYELQVEHERYRRVKWWSLQFPDINILRWGWNQLKPIPPEQRSRE